MKMMKISLVPKMLLVFAAMFLISPSNFAKANNRADKIVEKARQFVDEASPDDWYAMAKAAQMCIDKKVNLKEADEWLNNSLSIKETSFNTKVKGDYYAVSNLPQKAIDYYSLSIRLGKIDNPAYQDAETQNKILHLIKVIG